MADIEPRVNGARMNEYIGRHVRLTCKVTKVPFSLLPPAKPISFASVIDQVVGNTAVVEATDGAIVEVEMVAVSNLRASIS